MGPGRRRIIEPDDAVYRVFPFVRSVHPHAVLSPAEFPVLVDDDLVEPSLLPCQISHLHALQPLPRALLHRHVFPFPFIQPVEEILVRRRLFPRLVVFPQVAAVSMLHIHHLKEIREIHLLGAFDPVLLFRKAFLAPGFAVRVGGARGVIIGVGG